MAIAVPVPAHGATSIGEVIAGMQAIDAALPPTDGVACFNRMYLQVTIAVGVQMEQGFFDDPVFMAHLDVVFANRYFAAVAASCGPVAAVPVAWQPLLAARGAAGIEAVQFALAGMNAHINFDLPLAVVATCADLATRPADGRHHADYVKVDALLDAADRTVRQSFEPPDVRAVDRRVAAVADIIANWNINTARQVAWDTALALWEVRDHPLATRLFTGGLARTVAMAGRGLLVAV
jgi:hypothetical protein